MLDHWTDRERRFLGLLGFCLFLLFSTVIYFHYEKGERSASSTDGQPSEAPIYTNAPLGEGEFAMSASDSVTDHVALSSKNEPKGVNGTGDHDRSLDSSVSNRPAALSTTTEQGGYNEGHIWIVDVKGEVEAPGVYSLPQRSRVKDALEVAGGPTEDAHLDNINLAAMLADGMAVVIPSVHDSTKGVGGWSGMANSAWNSSSSSGKININTATLDELMQLPGVGESKASAILQYRQQHGSFRSLEELGEVKGIGPKLIEQLKPFAVLY